jgi:NitT/TauT family transport system substrate-binding protein
MMKQLVSTMHHWSHAMKALVLASSLALAVPPMSAAAAEFVPVNVGTANSATDVGFFIADRRGYFRDEGLAVNMIAFDSAARMIAPLASGDLDVGGGGPSAGLYNAVARGIEIHIVADKSSTPPGRAGNYLFVRSDLVQSGRFKTLADLKGVKIADSAPGASGTPTVYKLLAMAGLQMADIERVYMSFPEQAVALQNKAVDAAMPAEPSAYQAEKLGAGVRIMGDDQIYPNHQLATVFYSGQFIKSKPEAARKFMRAYLRGVRDFNDAVVDGKLEGPKGEAVIAILTEDSLVKDPDIYRAITVTACDPDGRVNVDSLKEDLDIFRKEGLIEGKVTVEQVLDTSFAEAAVKELGFYQPNHH